MYKHLVPPIYKKQNPFQWINYAIYTHASFAIVKIVISIATLSLFLFIHAFYNLMLAIAKSTISKTNSNRDRGIIDERKVYKSTAILILVISIVYSLYCKRIFLTTYELTTYPMILSIGIALFAFIELTLAMIGIIVARKKANLLIESLKMINLTSSLISLHLTQTAIMSFASASDSVNTVRLIGYGGYFMSFIIFLVSLLMLLRTTKLFQMK
ncbi:hypothetical protein [Marinilactibacillus kalidii]|uniref:hypothetical protein n=1 Tax=Marinilactibacillus kalidii TaxID=2820274 RepID=UPI001ABDE47C|nr:hypothetical protein [Marinilactibacillus kalidii]